MYSRLNESVYGFLQRQRLLASPSALLSQSLSVNAVTANLQHLASSTDELERPLRLEEEDLGGFFAITKEVARTLINSTTPYGLFTYNCGEMFIHASLGFLKKHRHQMRDGEGEWEYLARVCEGDTQLLDQEARWFAGAAASWRGCIQEDIIPEIPDPYTTIMGIHLDDSADFSWLKLDGGGGKSGQVPIDYRMVCENLSAIAALSVCTESLVASSRDISAPYEFSDFPPTCRYYFALSTYIASALGKSITACEVIAVMETLLVLSVVIARDRDSGNWRLEAVSLGRLLEAILASMKRSGTVSRVGSQSDEWKSFIEYLALELPKDDNNLAAIAPWSNFENQAALWCEFAADRFQQSSWWSKKFRISSLLVGVLRKQAGFVVPRLATDSKFVFSMLRTLFSAGVPVFSTMFTIFNAEVIGDSILDREYGIDSSEFDIAIISSLLKQLNVACPYNHLGYCTHVLNGVKCDDGIGSPSEHPCGFFDHRRDVLGMLDSQEQSQHPTRNLEGIFDQWETLFPNWKSHRVQ